jgi:hypothetical protein
MNADRSPDTTDAAVALLRRAAEIATELYEADPHETLQVGERWEPLTRGADSALFGLGPVMRDAKDLARGTALGRLAESDEARAFAGALERDETVAPYLGKMVWSGGSGVTLSVEELAKGLAHVALRDYDWDAIPAEAPRIWAEFIAGTLSEHEQLTLIAPLHNFQGPTEEVALGEGMILGQPGDEDIARMISVGAVTSPFPGRLPGRDIWVRSLWAVRVTYAGVRTVTEPGESPPPEAVLRSREQVMARAEGFVYALTLFKEENVSADSAILFAVDTALSTSEWMQRLPLATKAGRGGATNMLGDADVQELVDFHEALVKARAAHAPLDVAVRRFGDAIGRSRPDDQLTDLIISLEALLLNDSERGEKRFQVALRVAAFLEMPGTKRRDVLKFVKRAYDVRSIIVHGGAPRPRDLKNIAGGAVDLQVFADEALKVVRRLLRQVTEKVDESGEFAVDWEVQLLGEE